MPSGNDPQTVAAYYDYLLSQRLANGAGLRVDIDLTSVGWALAFAVVLIGFFFLYTQVFRRVHRHQGELYGATKFGASILERIGKISVLDIVSFIVIVAYAAFFFLTHLLAGQVY